MKQLLLFLFLSVAATASAQDVLVTEDGESIQAYDVDISGSQKIYYKTGAGDDAPMKSIAKEKILLWKKADGTKVRIGQDTPTSQPVSAVTTKPQTAMTTMAAVDAADPEANERAITEFNRKDIRCTEEMKNSVPKQLGLKALLHVTQESTMADKNVELAFARTEKDEMSVVVKNKTGQTIYVYLGNTFFLRHGIAAPFNISSASQSAMNGQAATATGFSQSVVAIPPQSSLDLGTQQLMTMDAASKLGYGFYWRNYVGKVWKGLAWKVSKDAAIRKNEERKYAPGALPLDYGFKVTYSFSENNTQLYHLDVNFYAAKVGNYDVVMKGLMKIENNYVEVGSPIFINILQETIK